MRKKINFVTVLLAVMLILICAGLFLLYKPAFYVLAGILGVYGFFSAAHDFQHWMAKDAPESAELPPVGFGAHEQKQEPPKKKKAPPEIIIDDPAERDEPIIFDAVFEEVPDYTSFRRYAV